MIRNRTSVYVTSEKAGFVKQRKTRSVSILLQPGKPSQNKYQTMNSKQICYARSLVFDTALHRSRD